MKVTNIVESGSNNVLLWAIKNGANIREDNALQNIINDELFYLVTFSDVSMFELFRLIQSYREKVRIVTEHPAAIPDRNQLAQMFPGDIVLDEENEKKSPICEIAEHALKLFSNLALQMKADDDIIAPSSVRLFFPMLSRKFDVQIPFGFLDFVSGIKDPAAAKEIFNENYPATLNDGVLENNDNRVRFLLEMVFVRMTSIIKYNSDYEKYMNAIVYTPLNQKDKENRLYKFRLLSLFKYNNITHGETRCSFFKADESSLKKNFSILSKLNTELKFDFAVELPIQHMLLLQNTFTMGELPVKYESSMSAIVTEGLQFHEFISQEFEEDEDESVIQEYKNSIEAYEKRIEEANLITLNTLPMILDQREKYDVDVTGAFSLLPSIYKTRAVITVRTDPELMQRYLDIFDPVLAAMFHEMFTIMEDFMENLKR